MYRLKIHGEFEDVDDSEMYMMVQTNDHVSYKHVYLTLNSGRIEKAIEVAREDGEIEEDDFIIALTKERVEFLIKALQEAIA